MNQKKAILDHLSSTLNRLPLSLSPFLPFKKTLFLKPLNEFLDLRVGQRQRGRGR